MKNFDNASTARAATRAAARAATGADTGADTDAASQPSTEFAALRAQVANLQEQLANYQEIEKALLASKARWHNVVENAAEVVLQIDRDGMILFLHSDGPQTAEDLVGSVSFDYVADEQQETMRGVVEQVFESGTPSYCEVRDRDDRWYGCRIVPLKRDGAVDSVASICTDITERKRQEESLRQSEERLRLMTEQIPAIIWTTDLDLKFTSSAGAGLANLRLVKDEVVGQSMYEFLQTEDREFLPIKAMRRALLGESIRFEQDWQDNVYESYVEPLRDAEGKIIGVLGVALDVTSRAAATKSLMQVLELQEETVAERTAELRHVNDSLLSERRLLRQLLELQERDRQLIAYEIHDGLVQDMTGAVMRLSAALRSCSLPQKPKDDAEGDLNEHIEEQLESARVNLATSIHLLQAALDESRRLINGLRPPVLEAEGLPAALENLTAEVSHTAELNIDLHCEVQFDRLAPALEMAIYRIVQESLNNVWKHSESKRAKVELVQHGQQVRIVVQDWGKGFDPKSTPKKRYGLTGIKERARLLDGKAKITSSQGQGATIEVTLPLKDMLLPATPVV